MRRFANRRQRLELFLIPGDQQRADRLNRDACLRAVVIYKPVWWALENPVNKLRRYLGPPIWRFSQWQYGDAGEKPTGLWGHFVPPMYRPNSRTRPSTWKTKYENASPEDAITPAGFAQAFFEANP